MAKVYQCGGRKRGVCFHESEVRWIGRCESCKRYYDILIKGSDETKSKSSLASLAEKEIKRISTGIAEVDKVLGGGMVPGSSIVISGPPGGGKSTLLLTIANNVATEKHPVLYTSGEQSREDIAIMAKRINALSDNVEVLGNNGDAYEITKKAEDIKASLVIVDSIQTAYLDDSESAEGSAQQVKDTINYLTAWCKREKIIMFIISQVDKKGDLAGPNAMAHLCDIVTEMDPYTVYDDDGELDERTKNWKMLSSGKNRYGASGVSELLEMTESGIKPVKKKSKLEI